jgi:hypothetical protein
MLTAMRRLLTACLLAATALALPAQSAPAPDPLASLNFLLGTWSAQTAAPDGSAAAAVSGTYTFRTDLSGHAIERTSSADTCKAPGSFDCEHHDRLTIFTDPNGLTSVHQAALFAFYLDNEGHVIYYTVSTPDPHTAVFNSQGAASAPKFRLVYHLEGDGAKAVMSGKFQMAAPGSEDYHSYLEWSGTKQ